MSRSCRPCTPPLALATLNAASMPRFIFWPSSLAAPLNGAEIPNRISLSVTPRTGLLTLLGSCPSGREIGEGGACCACALADGSATEPAAIIVALADGSATEPVVILVALADGSATEPVVILGALADGSATEPVVIVVALADGSATEPVVIVVALADGSATELAAIFVPGKSGLFAGALFAVSRSDGLEACNVGETALRTDGSCHSAVAEMAKNAPSTANIN